MEFHPEPDAKELPIGSWTRKQTGEYPIGTIITYGSDVDKVIAKAQANNISIHVVNARFFKPMDESMLQQLAKEGLPIIVYETDMRMGGLSSAILEYYNDHQLSVSIKRIGLGDHFIEHGSMPQLRKAEGIDINTLFQEIGAIHSEIR